MLDDRIALDLREGGHESMGPTEEGESVNQPTAHHFQATPGIATAIAQQFRTNSIGQARHNTPPSCVLSSDSNPTHQVRRGKMAQEQCDVARVILSVAIHCRDDIEPRGTKSSEEGCGLP